MKIKQCWGRNIYYQVINCRQGKRKEGVMLSHRTNVNISVQKKNLDTVKPSGSCPVHSTQSKQGFGPCSKREVPKYYWSKEWQWGTLLCM